MAPVVVKPEIVSKYASTKFGIDLLIINGKHPNNESMIHDKPTITNPSLAKKSLCFC